MKIGIDARVLDRKITGTGRYLINVLNELPNVDKENEYYLFTNSEYQFERDFYKIINYNDSILPTKLYSPIWLNYVLPKLIEKYKIELLFEPNVIIPIVNLRKTKIVSVVHDVIPKVLPEYYPYFYKKYLSMFLPPSLRKSNIIITVSQLSKDDIQKYYSISGEKIKIAYNTASAIFKPRDILEDEKKIWKEKLHLPEKYLLYVGAIEKRKNVIGVIKILELLREKGSKLQLVMVGKPGYDYKNIQPLIEKNQSLIKSFHYLEDEALAYTYNMAFAFVFPSFYEGFGIPPLEAMQSGIPVLSSNVSSLKEVVSSGGIMHDPKDFESFADDIIKLENDSRFYSLLKNKAVEQAKIFNIMETTKRIVQVFNKLGNEQ